MTRARPISGHRQPHTPDALRPRLARVERGFRSRWLMLMLAGAAVAMIGPVLFGSAWWLRNFRAPGVGIGVEYQPWIRCVLLWAAILLPVLFLIEWVTRGRLFDNTVEAMDDMPLGVERRLVGGAFLAEMCLWGPRMITAGFRNLAGLARHRDADRVLAAAIIATLLNRGEGVGVVELYAHAQGRDDAFGRVLAYLLFYELIGMSKNGDRLWLLSDAKKVLAS